MNKTVQNEKLVLCSWPLVDIEVGKRKCYHAQELVDPDKVLM